MYTDLSALKNVANTVMYKFDTYPVQSVTNMPGVSDAIEAPGGGVVATGVLRCIVGLV